MLLLQGYRDTIVPALEEKVMRRFNNGGERQVCIVKQEDGASLHQCKTYLKEMSWLFEERDWLLFNQPSQSPITNVHNACVFPMMSKAVSPNQALVYGARLMKGEELNKTVMTVWTDKTHLPAILRAFVGHSQIVCAILEHKGNSNYLLERGGLLFVIRRMYMTNEEGEGVIPVPLAMVEGEKMQSHVIHEGRARGLQDDEPAMADFVHTKMTEEMQEFLMVIMDGERMEEEVAQYWMREADPN